MFLETKTSLIATLANDYPRMPNLYNDDVLIMTKACIILSIFKTITEMMSSDNRYLLTNKIKTFLGENHNLPIPV